MYYCYRYYHDILLEIEIQSHYQNLYFLFLMNLKSFPNTISCLKYFFTIDKFLYKMFQGRPSKYQQNHKCLF